MEPPSLDLPGALLHGGEVLGGFLHPVKHGLAHFGATKLSTPVAEDDTDDVAILEETAGSLDLGLEVVILGHGAKLDLLDLDRILVATGFLGLLLLLILILAPVHDLDDGGAGLRGHFDEIEVNLSGSILGGLKGNDAHLLSIGVDETDWADADLIVDSGRSGNLRYLLERDEVRAGGTSPPMI